MSLDFFSKLETIEQIILLLSLISTVGMILWFLRWFVLKVGEFFSGSISSEGKVIIKAKRAENIENGSHADCPLVKDIMVILQAQQVMLNKAFHVRDKEILQDQMAYAEQKVDLAVNQCEKSFCLLMERNGKKDYLYSSEYISYRALLEFIREKCLTKFRHMCKENHFLEKSDDEFNEYVQCHLTLIVDMITQYSKSFFPYYMVIPGYVDSVAPIRAEIKKHISDAIRNARTCSYNGKIKIETIVAEFSEEYEKLTGLKCRKVEI